MKKMKRAFAVLMSTSLVMSQMNSMAFAEEQKAEVAGDDKVYETILNCDLVQDFSCTENVHLHTSDCYHEHQTDCYEASLATDSNAAELTCAISTEDPQCEQTEHEHGDTCYTAHEHNDDCYEQKLVEVEPETEPEVKEEEPKVVQTLTQTTSLVGKAAMYGVESSTNPTEPEPTEPEPTPVAKIGEKNYLTLKEAIADANKASEAVVIDLLQDVFPTEKATIKKNITIYGNGCTISRDGEENDYTGTFFAVDAGATLTLDGGLTIDGGNNWQMDMDTFEEDVFERWNTQVLKADAQKWFTPEEGAPIATAYMITTKGGTVNLNDVVIKNNYSSDYGVVSAGANSNINLEGAEITHNVSYKNSGLAVNADGSGIQVVMNDGTEIYGNHVGGNHGIFRIYCGATLTMEGGEICNNTGLDSNGIVIGCYKANVNIHDGKICGNISKYGASNGRNAAVYIHTLSKFTMTGGQICHNVGRSKGGIDAPYDNGSIVIASDSGINEDGTDIIVVDNVSLGGWTQYDVNSGLKSVKSGVYTQDLDSFCVDGFTCIPYDDDDTRDNDYIVVDHYRVDYYVIDGTEKIKANSENLYLDGKCAADIDLFAPAYEYTDAETNKTITRWYTDEAMTQEYDFTKQDASTEILQNVKLYGAVEADDDNNQTPDGDDDNNQTPDGDDDNNQTPDGDDDNNQTPDGDDDNNQTPGGDDNNNGPAPRDDEAEPEFTDNTPAQETETEVIVVIEDTETPLGATPEVSENVAENVDFGVLGAFEIDENLIPLGALPATGTSTAMWLMMSVLSALGLAGTSLIERKKKRDK